MKPKNPWWSENIWTVVIDNMGASEIRISLGTVKKHIYQIQKNQT